MFGYIGLILLLISYHYLHEFKFVFWQIAASSFLLAHALQIKDMPYILVNTIILIVLLKSLVYDIF